MAVAIARTANPAGSAASSNVATYSAQSIGVAAADRVVVLCVGTVLANSGPTEATIDGVPMTPGTLGNQGALYSRLFFAAWPTGTTAEFKVTFGSTNPSAVQNHVAVYRVTGATAFPGTQNVVNDTDADPITTGSLTIPSSGGMIVFDNHATAATVRTWTGLTKDLDESSGTNGFRFGTAFSTTAGAVTTTVSGANQEDATLAYAIFSPSTWVALPAASSLTPAVPTFGTPVITLFGTDALGDPQDLTVSTPTLGTPVLGQVHGLAPAVPLNLSANEITNTKFLGTGGAHNGAGGTGTVPDDWYTYAVVGNGITVDTTIGTTTLNGETVECIDVRFHGTATAEDWPSFYSGITTPTVQNDWWQTTAYVGLQAGSWTNVDYGGVYIGVQNSSGTWLENIPASGKWGQFYPADVPNSTLVRVPTDFTAGQVSQATAAKCNTGLSVHCAASAVVDITLRYVRPQIERGQIVTPAQATPRDMFGTPVLALPNPDHVVGTFKGSRNDGVAITVALSDLQQGDVVYVAQAYSGPNGNGADPGIATSGYTPVATQQKYNNGTAGGLAVHRKVMGSTPDTSVVTGTPAAGNDYAHAIVVMALRGMDISTPEDATATKAYGNSSNPNPASIVTVTDNAIVLAFAAAENLDTAITEPTGYHNQVDISQTASRTATIGGASKTVAAHGTEDPATWTAWSTGTWAAVTIAVRPTIPPVDLSADNLTVAVPPFGTPALVDVAVFSATPISLAWQNLGTPALKDVAVFSATPISLAWQNLGTPALKDVAVFSAIPPTLTWQNLGTPALVDVAVFTALPPTLTWQALGTPALKDVAIFGVTPPTLAWQEPGTPVIGQKHNLSADPIGNIAPTFGTPDLSVGTLNITLYPSSLTVAWQDLGTPALKDVAVFTALPPTLTWQPLGTPALSKVLSATSLTVPAPTFGTPLLTKLLSATALTVPAPTLGSPALKDVAIFGATPPTLTWQDLGTPTLGQKHGLGATAIGNIAPTFGTPVIGQKHNLAASEIGNVAPVLGTPVLVPPGELGADSFTTGVPVLGTPTLGQNHKLAADAIANAVPTFGTPVAIDVAILGATSLTPAVPTFGTPALTGVVNLSVAAIGNIAPVLGQPTLGQNHKLAADVVTNAVPTFGTPTLLRIPKLTASVIGNLAPVLGTPVFGQAHALHATTISLTITLPTPPLGQAGDLVPMNLEAGAPVLGTPTLHEKNALAADSLTVDVPVIADADFSQGHTLVADDLTPDVPLIDAALIGQEHALAAESFVDGVPTIGIPVIHEHVLGVLYPDDLFGGSPILGTPTMGLVPDRRMAHHFVIDFNLPPEIIAVSTQREFIGQADSDDLYVHGYDDASKHP